MKIVATTTMLALMLAAPSFAHEAPAGKSTDTLPPANELKAPVTGSPKTHSGGTDSRGCHTNHQTGVYHCHKPK